jgi:hypothetical protein
VWIRNWETTRRGSALEVAAEVDGFRLWYRVPGQYPVAQSADPFLAAAFLPAMARGEELKIDPELTVSPMLLKNVLHLQEIHHTWNPALKMVPITASTACAEELNRGTLAFFSGGVDSTYTFLKHEEDISHLVFIHGFDFCDEDESYRVAVERNSRFADTRGKTLLPVETNNYDFTYRYALSRNLSQGSALGSVALLLGFATAYVPSSLPYDDLSPLGSHPLLDPLYSNEAVEVVHDGCEARRTDKLRRILASDAALANLRVCFEDMNVNCGHCAKCLRTMIPLKLLGAKSAPFPPLPPAKTLAKAGLGSAIERGYFRENVELAVAIEAPQHRELRDTLRKQLRRAEIRTAVKGLDRALFGGRIRLLVKKPPRVARIESAPDD